MCVCVCLCVCVCVCVCVSVYVVNVINACICRPLQAKWAHMKRSAINNCYYEYYYEALNIEYGQSTVS